MFANRNQVIVTIGLALAFGMWTSSALGQDECANNSNCLDCIMDSLCGWCDGHCMGGHASGPSLGSCTEWAWTPDDCPNTTDPNTSNATYTYYRDVDGDGYGDPNSPLVSSSATPPAGYVTGKTDPNDHNAAILPVGAGGNTYYIDVDGDGYGDPNSAVGSASASPPTGYVVDNSDSSDQNAAVGPAGVDTHTYYRDLDGDGYGDPAAAITSSSLLPPSGYASQNTDPDDTDDAVVPVGAGAYTYYADADGDGLGDPGTAISSNNATPPAGFVKNSSDSNDDSATTDGPTIPPCGAGLFGAGMTALMPLQLLLMLGMKRKWQS